MVNSAPDHPAQVLVIRLTADRPGSYTGNITFRDPRRTKAIADQDRLTIAGALSNGLKYETQIVALHGGGTLQAAESGLQFSGCDNLTLILSAGTDYAMDYAAHYRGKTPHDRVTAQAMGAPFKC